MRVQLVILTDQDHDENTFAHGLEFDLPEIPRTGECVVLSRPGQAGSSSFIVRAVHWNLKHPDSNPNAHGVGEAVMVTLECEFAIGPYDQEEHK